MVEEQESGWHLNKEVSLAHLLTTILVVVGVLTLSYKLDERMAHLEGVFGAQHFKDVDQDRTIERLIDQMNERLIRLTRLEAKIDILLERTNGKAP